MCRELIIKYLNQTVQVVGSALTCKTWVQLSSATVESMG